MVGGGLALLAFAALASSPFAQELPATCDFTRTSVRDPFLHFTAWEDRDGVIRGRLKNTHEFETARETAIRLTFSLNPRGGGYQGSFCILVGDIPPGGETTFEFIRPEAVRETLHVQKDPHALW